MKQTLKYIVLVLILSGVVPTGSLAYDDDESVERVEASAVVPDEGRAPGRNYVRVSLCPLSVEVGVPGFWRVSARAGYSWVDGYWIQDRYYPGYWQPTRGRGANWAWVPGHWGGNNWIPGRWRIKHRDGFTWLDGHWTRSGVWIEGYWRPLSASPRGLVWEPGYWSPRGWVEGFWRAEARPGHIWISGEWGHNNTWICGRWQQAKADEVWVHGYWDRRGIHHAGQVRRIYHQDAEPGWNQPRHEDRGAPWTPPRGNKAKRVDEKHQIENYREAREDRPDELEQLDAYKQDRESSGGSVTIINKSTQPQVKKNQGNAVESRKRGSHVQQKFISQGVQAGGYSEKNLRSAEKAGVTKSTTQNDTQREEQYRRFQSQR